MTDAEQAGKAKTLKKERKAAKPKVMKWRGLLADTSSRLRVSVYLLLVVAIITLGFTQLGLVGLGAPGAYLAYGNVLLAIVALGGLLYGVLRGTLLGLIAGVVMSVHAIVQPLDYFEVMFITPVVTTLGFIAGAFITSLFIALVMRGKPSRVKGIVGIVIVCFVMSLLYSIFFTGTVFVSVVAQIIEEYGQAMSVGNDAINSAALYLTSQLGNLDIQILFDAALMAAACIIAWIIVDRLMARRGGHRLPFVFRMWLFGVVLLAFMLASTISFVIVTEQAKSSASEQMSGEIDYLCNQLESYDARMSIFKKFAENDQASEQVLDAAEVSQLELAFSPEGLVQGYDVELDGSVVVFADGKVMLSNDPYYVEGKSESLYLGEGYSEEVSELANTGIMSQVVYDRSVPVEKDSQTFEQYVGRPIATQVAYVKFRTVNNYTVMILYPSSRVYASRSVVITWTTLIVLVLLVVIFLFTSRLLNSLIVRRIDETNGVLARITGGDLTARVDVRDTLELGSLSDGINETVTALRGWIAEAETRMESELATAKAIQESALPRIFPPFPDNLHFDIYASMKAAREVGGDFYDFFLIGDDCTPDCGKLGFVIADVSGKGVPASLFMMTAKTLVRDYMTAGLEVGEAIENANRQLCAGNDTGMFVTLFAGSLDYATGKVSYVNAGHNPPLVWQSGAWRWISEKSGLPLGLFDGFPYETFYMDCAIGDEFLLYTDGVTEAMDPEGQLYGEERLMKLVEGKYWLHPRQLVHTVRSGLTAFVRGADQSDDITILALEVGVPPEKTATLIVPAKLSELPNVIDFIHTELDRRLCPVKAQKQLEVAIEEMFVNVAHYAYPEATDDDPGFARISYSYSAEPPSVVVEIADDGVAFDPLAKPDAVTPDDIMDVPIGGLGILMAKKSVDEMTYARIDNSNVLTLVKKW